MMKTMDLSQTTPQTVYTGLEQLSSKNFSQFSQEKLLRYKENIGFLFQVAQKHEKEIKDASNVFERLRNVDSKIVEALAQKTNTHVNQETGFFALLFNEESLRRRFQNFLRWHGRGF